MTAKRFNEVVRSHWGIENRLHWRLDRTSPPFSFKPLK
jgi:predicted transposase YbfD/YdcC